MVERELLGTLRLFGGPSLAEVINVGYLFLIVGVVCFSGLGVLHKVADFQKCLPSAINAFTLPPLGYPIKGPSPYIQYSAKSGETI
jgi:hypothetical protein